jgi:hypothetical protein
MAMEYLSMIDELDRLLAEVRSLKTKLVLVVGPSRSGKSKLCEGLTKRKETQLTKLGRVLGRRLLQFPRTQRHLAAPEVFKEILGEVNSSDVVFIDNIEILFDRSLRLDPLKLMKQQARFKITVATWPGEIRGTKLVYAESGNSEYYEYECEGFIPVQIHSNGIAR